MKMTDIKIYAAIVIMALSLGLSFISKHAITSTLCVALSIIIGAIIFRQLSNQMN